MKSKKIYGIVKSKNLVIPSVLFMNYKELKLDLKELLFLSFLMSYDQIISFDPVYFSNVLGFEVPEVMELISNLSNKKYIKLEVKNSDGKIKEYIDITYLYEKLTSMLIEGSSLNEQEYSDIYKVIETELGRTLSPIEYETIARWINANVSEELIKEALKEAVLNGVRNLKYIDKIIYEWTKKGYKKASDVRRKPIREEKNIELFEYDWLDEND